MWIRLRGREWEREMCWGNGPHTAGGKNLIPARGTEAEAQGACAWPDLQLSARLPLSEAGEVDISPSPLHHLSAGAPRMGGGQTQSLGLRRALYGNSQWVAPILCTARAKSLDQRWKCGMTRAHLSLFLWFYVAKKHFSCHQTYPQTYQVVQPAVSELCQSFVNMPSKVTWVIWSSVCGHSLLSRVDVVTDVFICIWNHNRFDCDFGILEHM